MASNPDEPAAVEVRFDVPRAVFDVYDAKRMALRMTKQAMGQLIFTEWAQREVHVAKVIHSITRGKGIEAPSEWGSLGE